MSSYRDIKAGEHGSVHVAVHEPFLINDITEARRTIVRGLGIFRIAVLTAGTLVILAVVGFLGFLWHGARAAKEGLPSASAGAWGRILDSGWLLRLVTLSSLLVRIVVAAQAAIATEMLSSIVLENGRCSLPGLARLSITRCQTAGPYQLALAMRQQLHGAANIFCAVLLATLLAVTVTTQFSSTVLLADFGSARIVDDYETSTIRFGFNYSIAGSLLNPYHGANYWTARPSTFFRFAEDSAPAVEEDGVFDTGFTARAFLPFDNSTQRIAARSYAGPSTVMDARVVCVRPRISITGANLTASTTLNLWGSVSWDGQYGGLRSYPDTESEFTCLLVPGSDEDVGPPQRKVSLCAVDGTLGFLRGGVRDDRELYTTSYLIINSTATTEGWLPFLQSKTEVGTNGYSGTLDATDFAVSGASGTWQGLRLRSSIVGIDATLCFANPIPWNYEIEAESGADGQEPVLRWNVSTGAYSSGVVRDFLGASREPRSPEDRGLLRILSPLSSNWSAADTDTAMNITTINYVWSAVAPTSQPVVLNLVSTVLPSDPVVPHRQHVGLFQEVLAHTDGNAALAVQALFTTLAQMAYHDYMAEFDVGGPAAARFSRGVVLPLQWKGFVGFCAVVAAHVVLLFVVAGLFLARTSTSLLGNAWQAVGQVVAVAEREMLLASVEKTDEEVEEYLRCHGASERRVRIRPRAGKGDSTELRDS